MQVPLTVKFSPDWDFETFLYKNYGSSHSKNDRSKAFAQFNYCVANYEPIEEKNWFDRQREIKEQREMDGDNSILGNPAY